MNFLLLWLVCEAWSDGNSQHTSAGLGPARKRSRVVCFYRLASLPASTSACLSISVPSSLPSPFSPSWFTTSSISPSMPVLSHTCNCFTKFISVFGSSSTSTDYLNMLFDRAWSWAWLKSEKIFLQQEPVSLSQLQHLFGCFVKHSLEKELNSSPSSTGHKLTVCNDSSWAARKSVHATGTM